MALSIARLAVVGSINIDIAVRMERLPMPGETLHGTSFALSLGGKGANQAVAARRLGGDVTFVGRLGRDGFGEIATGHLGTFGLDLAHVTRSDAAGTGIATISIDRAGQNAIVVVAGANALLSPADVAAAAAGLAAARTLLLQCETPVAASLAAARMVRAAGGQVILDPAPVPAGGIDSALLALADVITPNELEAQALTGIVVSDVESGLAAARRLRDMGAASAIVKLGGKGVVLDFAGKQTFFAPIPVKVIDTVAAGDCFNAALGVALAEGATLDAAVRFANACGALAVTRAGASEAAPTRSEVDALLAGANLPVS